MKPTNHRRPISKKAAAITGGLFGVLLLSGALHGSNNSTTATAKSATAESVTPTSTPAPAAVPVLTPAQANAAAFCKVSETWDHTASEINSEEESDSVTELARERNKSAFQARRDKAYGDYMRGLTQLLANGVQFKLKNASIWRPDPAMANRVSSLLASGVKPAPDVYKTDPNAPLSLQLEFETDDCYQNLTAQVVPSESVKDAMAAVPVHGLVTVYAKQPDPWNYQDPGWKITQLTLTTGQTIVTEPMVRSASQAEADHRTQDYLAQQYNLSH